MCLLTVSKAWRCLSSKMLWTEVTSLSFSSVKYWISSRLSTIWFTAEQSKHIQYSLITKRYQVTACKPIHLNILQLHSSTVVPICVTAELVKTKTKRGNRPVGVSPSSLRESVSLPNVDHLLLPTANNTASYRAFSKPHHDQVKTMVWRELKLRQTKDHSKTYQLGSR